MAEKVLFVGPLDRVLFLRTLPALDGLASSQLAAVAQHAREQFVPRGTAMLRPDQPADAVFVIVDGQVTVSWAGGRTRVVGGGEAVGFLELLARSPQGIDVRADVDTLALELDWDAQLDVCEEHFGILLQYLRYLSGRFLVEFRAAPFDVNAAAADLIRPDAKALNLVERLEVLSRSRAFSTTTLDALNELAHHVAEVSLQPTEAWWRRNDPADHFMLIARGLIRGDTDEGASFRLGPAAAVGMHEALRGERRWFDAVPETEGVALRIDVEPFIDILEDHFDMAVDVMSVLAQRVLEFRSRRSSGVERGRDS